MPKYKLRDRDQGNYTLKWFYIPDTNGTTPAPFTPLDEAFLYQTMSDTDTDNFWGYLESYGGDGYVANLGTKYPQAKSLILDLRYVVP